MLRLSIPEQLDDLREISDTVSDYLSRELFKVSFGPDGDYTVNDILKECYSIVLQELNDFGISFSISTDELLEDWYTAKRIYYVRKIVAAEYLKQNLTNANELDRISALLENDEIDTDFFLVMFESLYPARSARAEFKELQDFAVFVVANERFEAHVRAILEYLTELGSSVSNPDTTRMSKYISKVMASRKAVAEAVKTISSKLPLVYAHMDKKLLQKLIDDYDRDKISAEDIGVFSFIDMGEVEESLYSYRDAMLLKHHERSPHHIEYWTAAWKVPAPAPKNENLLMLVAHLVDNPSGNSRAIFEKSFEKLLTDGLSVFSPEQVDLLREMAAAVLPSA